MTDVATGNPVYVDTQIENIRQQLREQLTISEARTLSIRTALAALGDLSMNGHTPDQTEGSEYSNLAEAYLAVDANVADLVPKEVEIDINRVTLGEAVTALIDFEPDRQWTAEDMAERLKGIGWKTKSGDPRQVVYACLSVLARKGKIVRSGKGSYSAKPS